MDEVCSEWRASGKGLPAQLCEEFHPKGDIQPDTFIPKHNLKNKKNGPYPEKEKK